MDKPSFNIIVFAAILKLANTASFRFNGVAISRIVNARMENARGIFGNIHIDDIRKNCLRTDMHVPSEGLLDILRPLKVAYKAGGVLALQCEVEIAMDEEAKRRRSGIDTTPMSFRVLDAICQCKCIVFLSSRSH